MENTLLIGDHLLVNKFAYAYPTGLLAGLLPYRDIRRGDVVVFKFPPSQDQTQSGEHFVKRMIGLPGDRIRIFHRQVFVNGQVLEEPFVRHTYLDQLRPGDDFPPAPTEYLRGATPDWSAEIQDCVRNGELVVPPGQYFVMGDNREQSWDSRFWGFVPRELISGKPLIIYWSYESTREDYTQNSLSDRLRQTFDLGVHFVSRTRWRRTFGLVR
jgi:signal peptidase I